MHTQNQIKKTLSEPRCIEYISEVLVNQPFDTRNELAAHACAQFHFYDVRGKSQIAGCLKALRELESAGHFILPVAKHRSGSKSPRRLNAPVLQSVEVPESVSDIQDLKLIRVTTNEQRALWNELMITEHPLGATLFAGRQLRYLIDSRHGVLGGIGYAAPALQLADREQWIGWDADQRRTYLHYVAGMNRFLIRPGVRCRNLASKVLSLSTKTMADDFEQQYGYRPLLIESFVDKEQYAGTCYRAANWTEIGETAGRGRQDRFSEAALSTKAIYIYPVDRDFRQKMGLPVPAWQTPLSPADGIDSDHWAQHEFGDAPVGDARLSKRLVNVAAAKADNPGRAFCGVAKGDWPATKGYYRMIDQPEESEFNLPNILAPHRERTIRRMMGQDTVLCIQDGSELTYTNLDKCRDLGDLKSNQTGAKSRGLVLQTTLAVAPDGLPLGVLKAQCIAPAAKSPDDRRSPKSIPIEEKKTFVWIEHHRDLVQVAARMPDTGIVHVCDREADFFDLFDEQRHHDRVDLLVRASHNRNLKEEPFKLFEAVRETEVLSRVGVAIPRESARTKKSKQKARSLREARFAELEVRARRIQLPSPDHHNSKEAVDLWLVHAFENAPPEGVDPVEWFLLTTVEIKGAADAEQCLRWYTRRWRIEDWHRVLKSGCRIGDLAHETAERLRRAIAINLVIAWRIMLMTLLGRETPELPADVLFSDIELRTLRAYATKKA
jgi:hypothetical protein